MRPTTLFRDTNPQFNRSSAQRRHLHRCRVVTAREWIEPAHRRPMPPTRPSSRVMLVFGIACIVSGWIMAHLLLP